MRIDRCCIFLLLIFLLPIPVLLTAIHLVVVCFSCRGKKCIFSSLLPIFPVYSARLFYRQQQKLSPPLSRAVIRSFTVVNSVAPINSTFVNIAFMNVYTNNKGQKIYSWLVILALAVLGAWAIVLASSHGLVLAYNLAALEVAEIEPPQEPSLLAPEIPAEPGMPPPDLGKWIHVKIKSGDNLARIFHRINLSPTDLHKIVSIGSKVSSLKKILPKQELTFQITDEGALVAIRYKKDSLETLLITRDGKDFIAEWNTAIPEVHLVHKVGSITKKQPSLYHAGKAAGVPVSIIMKLSYIFQWDISFAWDLRQGDSFSLLYEVLYVDGEEAIEGDIIAATFTNTDDVHHAVQYTDLSGQTNYYTPDGHSLRKAFIRDPVHFSHVSSSFNLRRLHPVHKRVMPHRGIDYAARRGTPIVASGDGMIIERNQNRASGKYVVIQHGEQYTTKYLHMSAFAQKIKRNRSVKQGETIGYVGATGWATAPHLHYEFLANGVHRNPKTVTLPKADPIPESEVPRFLSVIRPVLAKLKASDKTLIALSRPASAE